MVQQLKKKGKSNPTIQEITGISERTIRRINQESEIVGQGTTDFRKTHPVGRPSQVGEYESLIASWFSEARPPEDGSLKSIEVYTRLKKMGYRGGKTAVYDLVRKIRPKNPVVPVVRFEGLPGEFSQHDFGQRRVTFADGNTQVIRFFASRLKYSRFMDVQIVDNEQTETVIRGLLRSFERFGGMPLNCVFDNLKAVVDKRESRADGKERIIWTQKFANLVIDCGFIPIACYPYRPQQKGSVENLVGFVKGNFFCGRTFGDREDLIEQIETWLAYVNQERVCDATGEIPEIRRLRESLKACPHQAETYAFKISAVVRPTARVSYQGIEYSAPAELIGQTVTLHLQQQTVEIYLGERLIATHPRFPENGKSSVSASHAEQLFVFRRGKPYAQRQLLLELAPCVEPYLTELVHRRPHSWETDIDRIYQLYCQIGRTEVLAALALATEQRCFGSEYLIAIATDDTPWPAWSVGHQARRPSQ